jgi:hypothetical protein
MKYIAALAMALSLAACSNTVGTSATESVSGYSGKRVVSIDPHGVDCSAMVCPMIGAQWREESPKQAVMIIGVANAYEGITGATFMIDGNEYVVDDKVSMTDFDNLGSYRTSQAGFQVPLALINQITTANRAWLRLSTPSGYIEERIVDADGDSKAYHALKRFMAKVQGN